MNTTIEKVENVNMPNTEIEVSKEVDKDNHKKDQYCLKMLDYFIF
ncbi:hypothetical protein [Clostridium aciditolerans]|nr:hypothetical protein [Clostridium aciditolerans]